MVAACRNGLSLLMWLHQQDSNPQRQTSVNSKSYIVNKYLHIQNLVASDCK